MVVRERERILCDVCGMCSESTGLVAVVGGQSDPKTLTTTRRQRQTWLSKQINNCNNNNTMLYSHDGGTGSAPGGIGGGGCGAARDRSPQICLTMPLAK